jgi:monoamine oxidase
MKLLNLVGNATGMIQYERASLLEVLIDYFGLFRVNQYELVDGMEALVQAFVKRLHGKIQYNAQVNLIRIAADGVYIHWSCLGEVFIERFDYAICTVPAPALVQIEFLLDLPPKQKQAIRGITYASSAKTLFHVTKRPWEFEDGIYGGEALQI